MVRKNTPRLDRLISSLLLVTVQRGMKAKLARYLGIFPQQLNSWLNGSSEPGGEAALAMLEWVTASKVKTKKHAGRASTRPALRTRNQESKSNEKPKSNP
jgi:transcriptional regulator with XRE-family HTH domain